MIESLRLCLWLADTASVSDFANAESPDASISNVTKCFSIKFKMNYEFVKICFSV